MMGFPGGASSKELACLCRRHKRLEFDHWAGKIPLKEGMATHSSILAWRVPWTKEPGRLQFKVSQRVRHYWSYLPCMHMDKWQDAWQPQVQVLHTVLFHSLKFFWFYVYVCVLSCFSHVWLFATLWIVAHWAPLSMGLSRQEYWSGLLCPPPEDLLASPAVQADYLPLSHRGSPFRSITCLNLWQIYLCI